MNSVTITPVGWDYYILLTKIDGISSEPASLNRRGAEAKKNELVAEGYKLDVAFIAGKIVAVFTKE